MILNRKAFIQEDEHSSMDAEHLRSRVEKETRLPEVLDGDYHVSTVQTGGSPQRGRRGRLIMSTSNSEKDSKDKMMDMLEDKKDDIGVMRVEYIVPHGDKGEWISEQITEELLTLPYILRERKRKEDANDGDESVYVADYAVSTDWIED